MLAPRRAALAFASAAALLLCIAVLAPAAPVAAAAAAPRHSAPEIDYHPIGAYRWDRANANGVTVQVSPTIVPRSKPQVTVAWAGVPSPQPVDELVLMAHDQGVLKVVGWFTANRTSTWSSGAGKVTLAVSDLLLPYVVIFARGTDVLATSNRFEFANNTLPRFPRLALGSAPNTIRVMWSNEVADTYASVVYRRAGTSQWASSPVSTISTYSNKDLCMDIANETAHFFSPGFIYDTLIPCDVDDVKMEYSIGSAKTGFTDVMTFMCPPPTGANQSVDVILFGDLGTHFDFSIDFESQPPSAKTEKWMNMLLDKLANRALIFHNGDISYARGHGYFWNYFLDQTTPLTSRVMYMVSIGNHEFDWPGQAFLPSWSDYNTDSGGECGVPYYSQYHMPEPLGFMPPPEPGTTVTARNLWYSFNYGPVHFVVVSLEHDYLPGSVQNKFVLNDLAHVDRSVTPWVVFGGHRPMYSSTEHGLNATVNMMIAKSFEDMMYEYRVDLALWAHVHKYERTCPVYKGVCVSTEPYIIRAGQAPIHSVIGMSGHIFQEPWANDGQEHSFQPDWSVFRTANWGWCNMQANATHLHFEYRGDQANLVHDEFYLVRE